MCEENDKNFQGFLLKRIATDTMRLSGWLIYSGIYIIYYCNGFSFVLKKEYHQRYI